MSKQIFWIDEDKVSSALCKSLIESQKKIQCHIFNDLYEDLSFYLSDIKPEQIIIALSELPQDAWILKNWNKLNVHFAICGFAPLELRPQYPMITDFIKHPFDGSLAIIS